MKKTTVLAALLLCTACNELEEAGDVPSPTPSNNLDAAVRDADRSDEQLDGQADAAEDASQGASLDASEDAGGGSS